MPEPSPRLPFEIDDTIDPTLVTGRAGVPLVELVTGLARGFLAGQNRQWRGAPFRLHDKHRLFRFRQLHPQHAVASPRL